MTTHTFGTLPCKDLLSVAQLQTGDIETVFDAARTLKPGFLVIPQNAEDLLRERDYRRVIDALGKEDLLYGGEATGKRNKKKDVNWSLERLNKLRWDRNPVFVVEYPTEKPTLETARADLVKLGMVPTFQHRSLDGSDPLDLSVVRPSGSNVGTPEYVAEFCKDKRWW